MRYVEACEFQKWHLMLSKVLEDGEILPEEAYRYKCRSWRHAGECCKWKGQQDYARIAAAVETRDDWVYVVLTFAQQEWPDWKSQYVESYPYWSAMRLRLTRLIGKFPYIQTWERHRKDGIHVNILIGSAELRKGCYYALKKPFKEWRWFHDDIERNAKAVGFGWVHWAQPMREGTHEGMAGYLTKLAKELTGASAKGQIPWDAPRHFRRLRASRGLLPPITKTGMIGRMVYCKHPDDWESDE